jgi:RNA polymerase sigma-70 factor (ECF subfamily)
MHEGRRVVAGEAILSGLATDERSRVQSRDDSRANTIENLVRLHSRLVYRIAYAVLRRHHDAEDATQETFLRVLRYRSKVDAVDDPKTWLARIAWRVAIDRARKRESARETTLDDPDKPVAEIVSSDASADDTVHGAHIESVLEKLIAALPSKLREPLILSTLEEMSPREVAATLGINEAAVRSRVFRARRMLKEKLAAQMSGKSTR